MKRILSFGAAFALVLMAGRPASAAAITSTADDFSVSWAFAGCGGTCTANADFDVTTFNATTLVLSVAVDNTLVAGGEFLEAIGWDMDPVATGVSLTTPGTFFDNARLDLTFPSTNNIDVCVDDNGQGSCGAGQPNGIPSPGSDLFVISLTGDFSGGSVNLTNFTLKYSGDLGSFEGGGQESTGTTDTGTTDTGTEGSTGATDTGNEVPEPASMLLLGSGLAGAAVRLRRNRK